jgi:hypothetical protein
VSRQRAAPAVAHRLAPLAAALVLGALLAPLAPARAGAQIIKVPSQGEPAVWTSLSVALFQTGDVIDGRSRSVWDLSRSSAAQYWGTVEWAIRNQSSVGLAAGWARVPFRYFHRSAAEPPPVPCDGCDAHVDIGSLALLFHAGGGSGFHQVIEAQAGVTRYSNLRSDDGARLAPRSDQDFSFTIGYGFGYSLSNRLQVSLVQDFGWTLHQQDGLANNESRTAQQRSTRLGVRYGLLRQKPKV